MATEGKGHGRAARAAEAYERWWARRSDWFRVGVVLSPVVVYGICLVLQLCGVLPPFYS